MSIDLDLVHDYMKGEEVPASELRVARSILDGAIALEIGDCDQGAALARGGQMEKRSPGRRTRWSIGLTGAAAAGVVCSILISQVTPPPSKVGRSISAAAQISRLADFVEPPPPLQAGQWSDYQMQGLLSADVSTVGNTATPKAQAAIPISLEVWSNSTATTCTSEQFGTATFASPDNAQAWHAIGLIDTPTNQPVTDCRAGLEATTVSALAAIDVSHITHDPSTLASELQGGTTGIHGIDQAALKLPASLAGFIRLTVLLVGPVSGSWSGFGQEILRTMALLPGVVSLGPTTAHSGQTGPGFSVSKEDTSVQQSGFVFPTVVLDPGTGALLEARDFAIPVLQAAAQDFVGSPSAPVYTEGVSYGINTQWIDPVASPGIVGQAALPAWISTFHVIEAVTKTTTTEKQLSTTLDPFLGNGNSAFSDSSVPGAGQTTFDITIRGSVADEGAVLAALKASGLFESVIVKS
jgi:hypothetical protein